MKKNLETSDEKLQKICDLLRQDTLEPAQKEAAQIVAHARSQAEKIIHDAYVETEKLRDETQQEIQQQHHIFQSSLELAMKQSLESLRQSIENKLLKDNLSQHLNKEMTQSQVIADLIKALIQAIQKEGLSVELSAFVPQHASVEEVNKLLGADLLRALKQGTVFVGDFKGGVRLHLKDKAITLDVTSEEVVELLRKHMRKDFRRMLFV